jgi:hypothetical protein
VYWLLNLACIPTYFLSVLWHQPSVLFNIIAGVGALIQCFALIYLFCDLQKVKFENKLVTSLVLLSFFSLALKMILQLLSALPAVATLAYNYRNFVIAYLHLVLLGCISLFLIGWSIKLFAVEVTQNLRTGIVVFMMGFISTELLLIASPLSAMVHYSIPHFSLWLLAFSILLPMGVAMVARRFFSSKINFGFK